MNFLESQNLLLIWLLPLVVLVLFLSYKSLRRRLDLFANLRIFELIGKNLSRQRVFVKGALITLASLFIIFALARPRWGYQWKELPRGGIDMMVVLDLSTSMLAQDISPNRLERAKREIIDLIQMLQGDRIGIVAFAGVSYVSCPLTSDYRLARLFLEQLSVDKIPVQGTDISGAVKRAAKSLRKSSEGDSEGKTILLISDGEDHMETLDPLIAELKKSNIQVFSIGIGAPEGAPIPDPLGGFKKDQNGQVVLSKLDETYLRRLSLETGGSYIRSTTGDMDLDFIYKQGISKDVAEKDYDNVKQKVWYERFQWFLSVALLCLVLEFFLSEYRRKES